MHIFGDYFGVFFYEKFLKRGGDYFGVFFMKNF